MGTNVEVIGFFVGKSKELDETRNSGIAYDQSPTSLQISTDEIADNEIVALKYHGGPDRVVHHYSTEAYDDLIKSFPNYASLFQAGTMGENLVTTGVTERDMRIGDVVQFGEVKMQVTEPRKPCNTIDINYGTKGVLPHVVKSGLCGWFYRVLQSGTVSLTDSFEIIERGKEEFNLLDVFHQTLGKNKDIDYLKSLLNEPALSERWRQRVEKIVEK